MGKFNLGNKRNLIILGTIIALLISGAIYYKFYKNKPGKADLKRQDSSENEENIQSKQEETVIQKEETKTNPTENQEKINYQITQLNKKDGDVFSVPDEVSFAITPAVDKSKITLMSAEGTVLYTGEVAGGVAKFTVYPAKKVMGGSQGTLLVEGYVGNDVVVFQKVKVVF